MAVRLDPAELNHNQATANLYVEGLALTHFNKGKKAWKINFLRNSVHKLQLRIRGNGINKSKDIEPSVQSITISTVKGIKPDFDQFPSGYWFSNQPFHRATDQGHDEDFRWVPDLANRTEFLLHGLVLQRDVLGSAIDSVTELDVPDVIFYTEDKTKYPLTQALLRIPNPFPFGNTNTTIGADILCEERGEIVIVIEGKEYARLTHVSGSPYKIEFENSDSKRRPPEPHEIIAKKFIKGDFDLYYHFVNLLGVPYDMVCPEKITVSADCDCNPSFVSRFD